MVTQQTTASHNIKYFIYIFPGLEGSPHNRPTLPRQDVQPREQPVRPPLFPLTLLTLPPHPQSHCFSIWKSCVYRYYRVHHAHRQLKVAHLLHAQSRGVLVYPPIFHTVSALVCEFATTRQYSATFSQRTLSGSSGTVVISSGLRPSRGCQRGVGLSPVHYVNTSNAARLYLSKTKSAHIDDQK